MTTPKRRTILKAALGAALAETLMLPTEIPEPAQANGAPDDALRLGPDGPLYQTALTPALNFTDALTLEAWVKAAPMPESGGRILDKLIPGTSEGYTLDTYPGNSLRLITSAGPFGFDAKLSASRWTHVVGIYSASEKRLALYIDGVEVARKAGGAFPPVTPTRVPLRIGADPDGGNRFVGQIRRAAVYGRALTAGEIAARASGGPVALTSLAGAVADWNFAAGTGRTIPSITGALPLTGVGMEAEISGEMPAPSEPLSLWYRRPAKTWLEALPIGNGRLGAMVFGGVSRERLQLNEGTVWAGGPHDYDDPDALAVLPEIRRLILADKWDEAQSVIDTKFMGKPKGQMPYQTVGNLNLDFAVLPVKVSDYRRELNLPTALARTEYRADGIGYTREVFASAPDHVMVIHLTADKPGALSFTAAFDSPQKSGTDALDGHTIRLAGVSGDASGVTGAVRFTALARAIAEGGSVRSEAGNLIVTGADAVTLLITMASSYRNYRDVGGDPETLARHALDAASAKPYVKLRAAHLADYAPLFGRVSLELGTTEAAKLPTDERVRAFARAADPQLAALHFQFGRYLLISCSRPGGQPATLQGLWNDSLSPPWGSKYTVNINTEMNYWPAAPANLIECQAPLVDLLGELSVAGRRTARTYYGAGGWVLHHNTDAWRGTAPVDGNWGITPTCGAWLALSLWSHYEYTGDRAALAKHYPILKGAAEFFLDALIPYPGRPYLVTCPTASPEIPHHPGAFVSAGSTMDNQILRDLFDACEQASSLLGIDDAFRAKVTATRARLAPMAIGHLGQLQEWIEDWDATADLHNRHVSHLYGLFPSAQITRRGTPDLFAAAQKSLEIRGDEATGWSLAWKINLWARLEDGDHAYKLVQMLLTPDRTAPNLFDLHPPFQIDGNFGAVSGVCEMLLQSHSGEIHLLPALPSAWSTGAVRGLQARGGHQVDVIWRGGRLQSATLHSARGGAVRLRAAVPVSVSSGTTSVAVTRHEPDVALFTAVPGGVYSITARVGEG